MSNPHRVLGHRDGKDAAGIGDQDSWSRNLIHRRATPAAVEWIHFNFGIEELRCAASSDENICVRKFVPEPVIVGKMHHAHRRPSLPNALGK